MRANNDYFIECFDHFLLRERIAGRERSDNKQARCQGKPGYWWVLSYYYSPRLCRWNLLIIAGIFARKALPKATCTCRGRASVSH